MNIILFGPPGAGKGTQAYNLAKDFNLYKISTGDLLRDEIKKNSELGKKIKNIIDKGQLVSDDITDKLIQTVIGNKKFSNSIIFDGYPRNLNQAENLDKMIKKNNQKISCVIILKVDSNILLKRIVGRLVCVKCGLTFNEFFFPATTNNHKCESKFLQKRSDDNEKTIKNRLETYEKTTEPILSYYQKQNLTREIDGKGDILAIYEEIKGIIMSLKTWL